MVFHGFIGNQISRLYFTTIEKHLMYNKLYTSYELKRFDENGEIYAVLGKLDQTSKTIFGLRETLRVCNFAKFDFRFYQSDEFLIKLKYQNMHWVKHYFRLVLIFLDYLTKYKVIKLASKN